MRTHLPHTPVELQGRNGDKVKGRQGKKIYLAEHQICDILQIEQHHPPRTP